MKIHEWSIIFYQSHYFIRIYNSGLEGIKSVKGNTSVVVLFVTKILITEEIKVNLFANSHAVRNDNAGAKSSF